MRRCKTHFGALGIFVAFAALLTFGGHANPAVVGGIVSAPSAPHALVESASLPWLLQSHLNGCGHASRSAGFLPTLRTIHRVEAASRIANTVQPHYGPLYRRPPPDLS